MRHYVKTKAFRFFSLLLLKKRQLERLNQKKKEKSGHQIFLKRDELGFYSNQYLELKRDVIYQLKSLIRINESIFLEILNQIEDQITKKSFRTAIEPDLRLLITLYFLANLTNYRAMS